jgi:hypothetical protein
MKYKKQKLRAIEIAKEYERKINSDRNNKFSIELISLTGIPGEWSVVYNVYSESEGIIDGPLVMIIDENERIMSLDEFIN